MMKSNVWKPYIFWVLLSEAVGALAGWITQDGMNLYRSVLTKPPLSPPAFVFPLVWGILFALMGIGTARIYTSPSSAARSRGLALFLIQLTVNFFWSVIFFNLQLRGFAFLWLILLWALVLLMILSFARTDRIAAILQIPYLLWITFAAYLNLGVWLLNR